MSKATHGTFDWEIERAIPPSAFKKLKKKLAKIMMGYSPLVTFTINPAMRHLIRTQEEFDQFADGGIRADATVADCMAAIGELAKQSRSFRAPMLAQMIRDRAIRAGLTLPTPKPPRKKRRKNP